MGSTINLRKRRIFRKKEVIVIVTAIILTTAGIKAADNLFLDDKEMAVVNERCGVDMVLVSMADRDFCVDKYEAAAGPSCPYSDPGSQDNTRGNLNDVNCEPVSLAGAIPWRHISQDQAVLACAKANKRLPTREEWFAAALGTPDLASDWGEDDCQVNNNWAQQPGPAGSGQNCISALGAYDMVGNVWEWVKGAAQDGELEGKTLPQSGFIDSTDGASMPGATNQDTANSNYNEDYFWIKANGLRGIARGGYWDNQSDAGQYSVYMVTPPSFAGTGVGFRCVK